VGENERAGSGFQRVSVTHDRPRDTAGIRRVIHYNDVFDSLCNELTGGEKASESGADDDDPQPRTAPMKAATFSGGVRRSMP